LSDVAIGVLSDWSPTSQRRGGGETTLYVVTAGSGDSYRVERVYLDGEQAYGFAQDYNGIEPVEPVQVEEWHTGARRAPRTGPTGARSGGRASRSASVAGRCGGSDEGERFDDFAIRQEWWTGEALPEAKVARRELAGAPRVEVVGLSKEKVEETFWDTVTHSGRSGGHKEEVTSAISCYGWNETGMAVRHCRPGAS
jgi:hypothetical protein